MEMAEISIFSEEALDGLFQGTNFFRVEEFWLFFSR
jgi:hypothetical protein